MRKTEILQEEIVKRKPEDGSGGREKRYLEKRENRNHMKEGEKEEEKEEED